MVDLLGMRQMGAIDLAEAMAEEEARLRQEGEQQQRQAASMGRFDAALGGSGLTPTQRVFVQSAIRRRNTRGKGFGFSLDISDRLPQK